MTKEKNPEVNQDETKDVEPVDVPEKCNHHFIRAGNISTCQKCGAQFDSLTGKQLS